MAPRSTNGAKYLTKTGFISLILLLVTHFIEIRLAGAFNVPVNSCCRSFQPRSSPIVGHRSFIPDSGKQITFTALTTKENDGDQGKQPGPISHAMSKFKARPGTYLLIPCVAAVVGWFTNWLAVQMIFYPVKFRGIPILIKNEVPLGLIGWQGIVPCKTRPMSEAMVNMVTEQLLSVKEAFALLDPRKVANLLAPEVPKLGEEVAGELLPKALVGIPKAVFVGLPRASRDVISHFNYRFLHDFTVAVQTNIDSLFNIKNCVVDQMLQDRTLLGQLFRKCGQKELDFLTNSGLWFGFLLGVIQMVVALFWDNPWSLSIGGGIVGLATNWLALKWIFEPVNPTKVGPFILQGQFLRRQKEVAKEFSAFFANNVLTSEKVWHSILTDPETTPAFHKVFTEHFQNFVKKVTTGLAVTPEPEVLALAAQKAITKLPDHVHVLHSYVDKTLNLQETLRIKMEQMTSAQFERVLHPIFEEDELTLILAGAALGFAAGLVQQGLETGKIKLPNFGKLFKKLFRRMKLQSSVILQKIRRRKGTVSANGVPKNDDKKSNTSNPETVENTEEEDKD